MREITTNFHPGLIGTQPVPDEAAMRAKVIRHVKGFSTVWMIAPATVWLVLFLVVPLASIIVFSFWSMSDQGMVPDLTLKHYGDYFTVDGFFNPEHKEFLKPGVFLRALGATIYYTLFVMVLCLLIGYPIAYFLAMQIQEFKWQLALFLLCMVPFWTSYLIRAVAWLPMLGRQGLINQALMGIGIIDEPASFLLYSEFGYVTALVQLYVVLCIGPIFFSLAKIPKQIIEAALDQYRLDMGAYPTALDMLVQKQSGVWNGPYLKKGVPADPWGNAYKYKCCPGQHGEYDVWSEGSDNAPGGEGEAADVTSWEANAQAQR